jgi:ABC-type transport system substrate-binding protein
MATQQSDTPIDPDPLWTLPWAPEGPAAYPRANVPEMQACLAEGRASYDPQKRHEAYKRCGTIWYDTAWWGVIWLQPWSYVFSKRLKGAPTMFRSNWREESLWLEG